MWRSLCVAPPLQRCRPTLTAYGFDTLRMHAGRCAYMLLPHARIRSVHSASLILSVGDASCGTAPPAAAAAEEGIGTIGEITHNQHTHTNTPTIHTYSSPPSPSSVSSSSSPSSSPSDSSLSLPLPFLIIRLADGEWSISQSRSILYHILDSFDLLSNEMKSTFSPTVKVERRKESLTKDEYEKLLRTMKKVNDLESFQFVWECMMKQFDTNNSHTSDPNPTQPPFAPSPLLYLTHLTLLLAHRSFIEFDRVWDEWLKSSSPVTLNGWHTRIQRFLIAGDTKKAFDEWRQLKVLTSPPPMMMDDYHEEGESQSAAPHASVKSSPSPPALKPTNATFHLVLRTLLQHVTHAPAAAVGASSHSQSQSPSHPPPPHVDLASAEFAFQRLSPILLDMEHQYGIEVDFTTITITLHIYKEIIRIAQNPTESMESHNRRNQRQLLFKQVWEKANIMWSIANKKVDQLNEKRSANTTTSADSLPSPSSSPALTLPAPLSFVWLDLCLTARRSDMVFSALSAMFRIGLLPSLSQCSDALTLIGEIAKRRQPTPPSMVNSKNDPGAYELAMSQWRKQVRALDALQQRAADESIRLLRCIRTHTIKNKNSRIQSNRDGSTKDGNKDVADDAGVTTRHYLSVFSILSSTLRFDEFTRLWRHLQAEHENDSMEQRNQLARDGDALDTLVWAALRMEGNDAIEGDEAEPDIEPKDDADSEAEPNEDEPKADADAASAQPNTSSPTDPTNEFNPDSASPPPSSLDSIDPAPSTLLALAIMRFFAAHTNQDTLKAALTSPLESASVSSTSASQPLSPPLETPNPQDVIDSVTVNGEFVATSSSATTPKHESIVADTSIASVVPFLSRSTRVLLLRSFLSSNMIDEFEQIFSLCKDDLGASFSQSTRPTTKLVPPSSTSRVAPSVTGKRVLKKVRPAGTQPSVAIRSSPITGAPSNGGPSRRQFHTSRSHRSEDDSMPTIPADQTLYALHSASTLKDVARCIHGLLGITDTNLSHTNSNSATSSSSSPLSFDPPHGVYHLQSGPLLLSGAVYELIFSKLSNHLGHAHSLALQVFIHMLQMRMRTSRTINIILLKLLAHAQPRPMVSECLKRGRSMIEELSPEPSSNGEALEYLHIILQACTFTCTPSEVRTILELVATRKVDQKEKKVEVAVVSEKEPSLQDEQQTIDGTTIPISNSCMTSETLKLIIQCVATNPFDKADLALLKSSFDTLRRRCSRDGQPIDTDVWTNAITAHADAGEVQRAIELIHEQESQTIITTTISKVVKEEDEDEDDLYRSSPFPSHARSISSSSPPPSSRLVSPRAFLSVIIACMEQPGQYLQDASRLFQRLHHLYHPKRRRRRSFEEDGNEEDDEESFRDEIEQQFNLDLETFEMGDTRSQRNDEEMTKMKKKNELPFAFVLHGDDGSDAFFNASSSPSSSSPLSPIHLSTLRFHFSPLSLSQFRMGEQLLRRSLNPSTSLETNAPSSPPTFASPLSPILPTLEELETHGRAYLSYALIDKVERSGVELTTRVMNLLIRSCGQSRPHAAWEEAEALFHWMSEQRIERQDLTWYGLIQCYSVAAPTQWQKAIELKQHMDEIGVPLSDRLISVLLHCFCIALDPDDVPRRGPDRVEGIRTIQGSNGASTPNTSASTINSSSLTTQIEPFRAAQELIRSIHPSLVTPRMHVQLMTAAILAGEYKIALDIFVTQYNADLVRMVALESSQSMAFSEPNQPRSILLERQPEELYFRSCLDITIWNGLMHACSCLGNPFHMYELYQLLQDSTYFRVFLFPPPPSPSPSSPSFSMSEPTKKDLAASTIVQPSTPIAVDNHLHETYATRWHLVSWIDAMLQLKYKKTRDLRAPKSLKKQRQMKDLKQSTSSSSSSPLLGTNGSPLPPMPTFTFSPITPSNASLPALEGLIASFQSVERHAYESLASPGLDGLQSVWQPFTNLESPNQALAQSTSSSSSSSSSVVRPGPPSPFHLNAHFLSGPRETIRSSLESLLHLSLRRIQSLYLSTGKIETNGWNIVHGHGRTREDESYLRTQIETNRMIATTAASTPSTKTTKHRSSNHHPNGFQPLDKETWSHARYKEPPRHVSQVDYSSSSTSSSLVASSPLARVVHRFLRTQFVDATIEFETQGGGNLGMTRITKEEIEKWIKTKRR